MIARSGHSVPGFALGDPPQPSECACRKIMGVGDLTAPAAVAMSPWAMALTTSVIGAAAGWMIEEIATAVRGRRR